MGFTKNQITLIGKLGRDAETRFTTNNVSVTSFSMVTEHSYKDKNDDWKNDATWHRIVMFNLSDYHKDQLKKGATVHVEGRQVNRSYDDNDGNKKYISEVIADKRQLITFGSSNSSGGDSSSSSSEPPKTEDNDDLPF